MGRRLHTLWQALRRLSGEDAYERYLAHWRQHHAHDGGAPQDRRTFYRQYLERKWNGIKRCC